MKLHYLNETPKRREEYWAELRLGSQKASYVVKFKTLCQKDIPIRYVTSITDAVTCKTCSKVIVSSAKVLAAILRGPRHVDCDCVSCRPP